MSTAPDLKEVARVLQRLIPSQHGAVLFGSRATGHARVGSDWDIGLVGPAPLRGATVQSVREALEKLPTLHSFDVVDLMAVSRDFRERVIKDSTRIL